MIEDHGMILSLRAGAYRSGTVARKDGRNERKDIAKSRMLRTPIRLGSAKSFASASACVSASIRMRPDSSDAKVNLVIVISMVGEICRSFKLEAPAAF